ncbi:exodeoxyribonuclease V subunit beta [Jeongeupia sp. USM3]|uniref:exodeoxyribonuclease V subunit beta n=1 Tax=Jeongeupia sp. USM3 TaxID=1906741 RepID=UPI00089DEA06|nr:exodeoxyribonuclease V subunit beta [Jeongeupia sp. USM3]AOY01806.1 exodeoxyribonuclease V subunit beta [Jeongeupia sp. USM3]
MSPTALDALTFPLHGSRLIEASAGTGKTFTIAALYVRLVLGHGGDAAFGRALNPPDILVVTFTDAATKELRDRIRARLAEAAAYFLGDGDGDGFLRALRDDYPPDSWAGCARKLQLAAEWMDEAAVSTIHGWCHRMLAEHAFDSGNLFTQTLETDQSELLAEVVRDYWRTWYYPLSLPEAATVQGFWRTPDALQQDLANVLEHVAAIGDGAPPQVAIALPAERLAEIKAPWAAWVDELQAFFDDAYAAKKINGQKCRQATCNKGLNLLREWRDTAALIFPVDEKKSEGQWRRLAPSRLAEVWKAGEPPAHPALEAIEQLIALRDRLVASRAELLRHAAHWVAGRFADAQRKRAQMGFNDLLTRLDAALAGPNGTRLAELIRSQFPVALIDEFQDTDPLQYRIFDTIYRVADTDPSRALVLIGDPKQAIYAFRGADIHTYLRARRATGGRHYTLATNYRSTRAMVAAVNRVFGAAEPYEAGAFLFRDTLPFTEVAAKGRDDAFVVDGEDVAALTCWFAEHESRGDYTQAMAATCASEIVRLLALAQAGRAGFDPADAAETARRPLRAGDIAVLVNTGKEAQALRQALAARRVRSVYLSDKESVFQSPQADELQRWLAACAEPENDRLLRAALATPSLALSWADLDALGQNEALWEARVLQFRDYRQCWRRQGVLPMLRRLLHDFGVPRRLAGNERALTDLLHLAELLQQASVQLDGEHALIRHMAEQRADEQGGGDARKLRLDSDADLVKVVTVHKSKGLEYPLVFLPFAGAFRVTKSDDLPLKWHDAQGELQLALSADAGAAALADRERLGEDLRKFYVALTRARYATWIGLAPLKDFEKSAPGYLLAGGEPVADLQAALLALKGDRAEIGVVPAPPASAAVYVDDAAGRAPAPRRRPDPAPRAPWWIASYSGLTSERAAAADSAAEDVYAQGRESAPDDAEPIPAAQTPTGELHAFPRGPGPGSFLHGLLEWAGRHGFKSAASGADECRDERRDLIARRSTVRGWDRWIDPLAEWLPRLLTTRFAPPDAAPFTLAALGRYRQEMEFWFPVSDADCGRLDALVRAHTLAAAPRPALLPKKLNGMLKGYIDLVFEHDGRYYVADYKSNWLGPDDGAYTPAAMRDAVLAHRYELQYVLYLFALHRLLKARLPDYDYDRHVGGALYLFLRGTSAPTQGLHFERPSRALIDELELLFAAKEGV